MHAHINARDPTCMRVCAHVTSTYPAQVLTAARAVALDGKMWPIITENYLTRSTMAQDPALRVLAIRG